MKSNIVVDGKEYIVYYEYEPTELFEEMFHVTLNAVYSKEDVLEMHDILLQPCIELRHKLKQAILVKHRGVE